MKSLLLYLGVLLTSKLASAVVGKIIYESHMDVNEFSTKIAVHYSPQEQAMKV